MDPFRLFAATGDTLARLDSVDGASVQTTIVLGDEQQSREGHLVNGVMCVSPLRTIMIVTSANNRATTVSWRGG